MRPLALLLASILAMPASAAGGNKGIKTVPALTAPVAAPALNLGGGIIPQLGPAYGAGMSVSNPVSISQDVSALAIAPALIPQVQAQAAAQQALSPADRQMAALEAFNETFQAEGGQDAASANIQTALTAIYEGKGAYAPVGDAKSAAAVKVSKAAQPKIDEIMSNVAKSAKARLAAFDKKVKAVKAGRFGLTTIYLRPDDSGRIGVKLSYSLDGRKLGEGDLERKIKSGSVTEAEWKKAKPKLDAQKKALAKEWAKGQDEYLEEIAQAKKDVRQVTKELQKARLNQGRDLQKWGVPNVTPVGLEGWLRYARLYRLGGQPTALGTALHEVLAPLVAKDPSILERITQQQLDTAILELSRGLRYRDDPASDDTQKEMRLGRLRDEGHDYPEWTRAHAKRAQKALASKPAKGVASAGLGMRKKEQLPTPALKGALNFAFNALGALMLQKAPEKAINDASEVIKALHAALAIPFGPYGFQTVKHKQLLYILPILEAMKVHEDVIKAVIRSYPLGESIYRLGVHKLWAAGLTGKGVKVAIIDDGVTFNHPDFEGVKKKHINLTRDRGDDALGPHGTAMADIVHAIAPEAELHVYQALSNSDLPGVMLSGDETDAAIMKALDMAEKSGAKIISMSLGAAYGLANDKYAKRLADLKKKGIVVIVSAGNSGDELPPGMQVGSPGSAPAALTVGAVDYHSRKADFSSKGPVYNPEHPIDLKDKPDIYAFGVNNKTAMALPKALYEDEPVPYRHVSGTSPATPHVSGVVALMVEAAKYAGKPLDNTFAGLVKSALLASAEHVAYRPDLPSIPVMLDAYAAVEKFLEKLTK